MLEAFLSGHMPKCPSSDGLLHSGQYFRGGPLCAASDPPQHLSQKFVQGGKDLDLREAAVYEQFDTGDVAAVIAGEKHDSLRDLIGCTEPAQRNAAGNHLQPLLSRLAGSQ